MKILPLVLLAGCVHNIEADYMGRDLGEVAYLWDMTEDLRFEVSNDAVGYSRRGSSWWEEVNKNKVGFFNQFGFEVYHYEGDEVTYFADADNFTFSRFDGVCRERYRFDLDRDMEVTVTLGNKCELFGELDEYFLEGFKVDDLSVEDQRIVEKRYRSLMMAEVDRTAWTR